MKERRKHERFQLEIPARLETDSLGRREIFELQTKNISAAGALLHTKERFSEGTTVHLELALPSETIKEITGAQSLIKIEGTIIRSTSEGVVICFNGECQILGLKGS